MIDMFLSFLFLYPIVMSMVWVFGSLRYYGRHRDHNPPIMESYPKVSILMSAYNEERVIREVVSNLFILDYPDYEIIVVDDCSDDDTLSILRGLQLFDDRLRVIHMEENMGKAVALNAGLRAVNSEIVVTIDADSYMDRDALRWIVWHFETGNRVGAVTGNPRVLNRTTLLSRIQTAEYSSIIGMIKRTQRIIGKVMTVSGVFAAFRMTALASVGGWDTDCVTEDIDVTWKLEKKFWDIRYEPNALIWILVPERFRLLFRQRVRWSQGGYEVLRKHLKVLTQWRYKRLWIIYFDALLAGIWSVSFVVTSLLWLVSAMFGIPLFSVSPLLMWWGSVIAIICLLQFVVAISLDRHQDPTLYKVYFWIIWYPIVYWVFGAVANVVGLVRSLFSKLNRGAVVKFVSPDRGLKNENK